MASENREENRQGKDLHRLENESTDVSDDEEQRFFGANEQTQTCSHVLSDSYPSSSDLSRKSFSSSNLTSTSVLDTPHDILY